MKEAKRIMTLQAIKATFACDGCGRRFTMDIDPASEVRLGSQLFEHVEDALRGGEFNGYVGGSHREAAQSTYSTSCQHGKHLCPSCTEAVDNEVPEGEDRNANARELSNALAKIERAAS